MHGTTSWRCVEKDCKGRLKSDKSETIVIVRDHNHAPTPGRNAVAKAMAELRRRARTTMDKPRQIIEQTFNGIPLESISTLPSFASSQRTIERVRKKAADSRKFFNSSNETLMGGNVSTQNYFSLVLLATKIFEIFFLKFFS